MRMYASGGRQVGSVFSVAMSVLLLKFAPTDFPFFALLLVLFPLVEDRQLSLPVGNEDADNSDDCCKCDLVHFLFMVKSKVKRASPAIGASATNASQQCWRTTIVGISILSLAEDQITKTRIFRFKCFAVCAAFLFCDDLHKD